MRTGTALAVGGLGMVFVGGGVAVSGLLRDAPMLTTQALRYAAAFVILLVAARLSGRRIVVPRGREWLWLGGVASTGLVLFNVALVRGSAHAEPAVLGVAVASVPVLLALGGRGDRRVVLCGAVLVTAGAALVEGGGRTDAQGLGWALVVLACEAGFTLLAVPVLGRHGPWGVSVHTCWMAAVGLGVGGLVTEGPPAVTTLRPEHLAAMAYLAVGVTAVAFVLWYSAVATLGAGRAGLLTGIAPVAATLIGTALGEPFPDPRVWLGLALVGAGLAVGMRRSRRPVPPGRTEAPART
ncbi:DMT family transporter [Pseudonocardia sp. N23]|uniref:DMT family transporter n=1 Tax=Pseudonocardia sp. N23 TaxID=1987376 RepID=UPI000BFD89C6|nr:DMT family transporter [Pseudonocardia sp. N23]GAY08781.1 integral membrane protein [Pseudonocardia sp. N23]